MSRNIHKHLILATLATVLGLAACDSTSSSSSSALVDFSNTPSGWTRKTNYPAAGITADVFLLAPASQNFSANALVMTTPTSGVSLSTAANSEIANTKECSTFSNVYVDSSKAISVNGQSAWLIQIRYHYNTVKADLLVREILFVYKSKDCQLVFTRLQSDSTSANAAALRALESQIVLN